MSKPIAFRPAPIDQALIEKLMEQGQYGSNTELVRQAIISLAMSKLGEEHYNNIVLSTYNKGIHQEG